MSTFIDRETIDHLIEVADIVSIIGEHVHLKHSGQQYKGCCPFHPDKTPSFDVSPNKGLYYCHGCHASGNVIHFVRQIEGLDFIDAVHVVAKAAGVVLPEPDPVESAQRKARLDALKRAASWFHQRLVASSEGRVGLDYLHSRGVSDDLIEQFQLGWAPRQATALPKALNIDDQVFAQSGLGIAAGQQRANLRDRIVFPINDASGRVIAFIGRKLDSNGPKYLNTPDTDLYHKSKVLYGLDRAKVAMVRDDQVVLCEGTLDVIACHGAGVSTAVATCGTAVTEKHVQALARYSRRFVLAYDADVAGSKAVERFYAWGASHSLSVQVANLPDGEDPAGIGFKSPEQLRLAIKDATPLLSWRVTRVLNAAERNGDLATPDQAAVVARRAMEIVQEHPDSITRAAYVREVAQRCRVPESALSRRVRPRHVSSMRQDGSLGDSLEADVLRAVVCEPEAFGRFVEGFMFTDERCRKVFDALVECDTLPEAVASLQERGEDEASALLAKIVVTGDGTDQRRVVFRFLAQAAETDLSRLVGTAKSKRLDVVAHAITRVHRDVESMCRVDGPASDAAALNLVTWMRTLREAPLRIVPEVADPVHSHSPGTLSS